jgi:hypothetical protein
MFVPQCVYLTDALSCCDTGCVVLNQWYCSLLYSCIGHAYEPMEVTHFTVSVAKMTGLLWLTWCSVPKFLTKEILHFVFILRTSLDYDSHLFFNFKSVNSGHYLCLSFTKVIILIFLCAMHMKMLSAWNESDWWREHNTDFLLRVEQGIEVLSGHLL